jgi:hypothetical protein
MIVGWDSVVSMVTRYGLDGLGVKSWYGQGFLYQSRLALGPTQLPVQWDWVFAGCKVARVWC